ncbi:hypothetical protein XM53_18310 [Roseovarius atlanticus]|uniref:Uncharacterized protein n=1 Tax=Roseovarius atlanticus TaxID=1641875 RepID=A0A0T5NPY3_9RHOB|nr:hypothetical protein [Roseovarius atlanticus]KRS11033.1 hypothetical protein XM53_18310 [Roseovarius atlanticus]
MSNHPTLKVPQERITQLKQMAANMGAVNMSEVLAKLIELAQSQGLINHEIPGVHINELQDGLVIRFDDGELTGFSFDEAGSLASEIRSFLSGERDGKAKEGTSATHGKFSLKGKGQGIAVSIPADGEAKVFDRGLASEFARLIEMATKG